MRTDSLSTIEATAVKKRGRPEPKASYHIVLARPEHAGGVHDVICLANDFPLGTAGCIGYEGFETLVKRFPEGQFVAVTDVGGREKVIGLAIVMRTDYLPSAPPRSWRDMIGDYSLENHAPSGRWLYGVEKAVHPDFQGVGIGSALYKAQFDLVRRLELDGMYAGGMLKGYQHYKREMSVREYADKVMRGELFDPTVSVQMRKGFKPVRIIENYAWDAQASHTGMLIVWEAPQHKKVKPATKPSVRPAHL